MTTYNVSNSTLRDISLIKSDTADIALKEQVSYASFVIKGVIIPVGLACNILSFLVFGTSKVLKRTSTGNYLMALSAADFIFLCGELIRWMNSTSQYNYFYLGLSFMFTNNVVCKLTHFVRYGSKLASAWITVAITTERFISIRWPLHVHQHSTPRRAKIVIVLTYIVCFGLGSYPLWTVAVQPHPRNETVLSCRTIKGMDYDIWNTAILAVGSLLLPGLLMCILTGLILCSLVKSKHARQLTLSYKNEKKQKNRSQNIEKQLTGMLLSVAIAFVLLRLPYTIMYAVNRWIYLSLNEVTSDVKLRIHIGLKITDVIASANYVVNFFLYCVCGSAVRRQLRNLATCMRYNARHLLNESQEGSTRLMHVSMSSPARNYSMTERKDSRYM